MTHTQIIDTCLSLALQVRQTPDDGKRSYSATAPNIRVYWSTSYEGSLLGLPRVNAKGTDTHARSLKEIAYLRHTLA